MRTPAGTTEELRRTITLVAEPARRRQLLALLDRLERDAGWTTVDEIRASHDVERLAASLAEAEVEAARLHAAAAGLNSELAQVRRARDQAEDQLRELRDIATEGLDDELVAIAVRWDAERPTSPPLLSLRRAAALIRAVRSTG